MLKTDNLLRRTLCTSATTPCKSQGIDEVIFTQGKHRETYLQMVEFPQAVRTVSNVKDLSKVQRRAFEEILAANMRLCRGEIDNEQREKVVASGLEPIKRATISEEPHHCTHHFYRDLRALIKETFQSLLELSRGFKNDRDPLQEIKDRQNPSRAIRLHIEEVTAFLSSVKGSPEKERAVKVWEDENLVPATTFLRQHVNLLPYLEEADKSVGNIVDQHRFFLLSLATRYSRNNLETGDLFQQGAIAFREHTLDFDPTRDNCFLTHVGGRVKWAIHQLIIDESGGTIHVPGYLHSLSKTGGKEIALPSRVAGKFIDSVRSSEVVYPLANFPTPVSSNIRAEQLRLLEKALLTLSAREQRIIKERWGFDSGVELSLEEVGAKVNLGREQTRKIEKEAMAKVAKFMAKGTS